MKDVNHDVELPDVRAGWFSTIKDKLAQKKINLKKPKKSCRRCFGRGYIGRNVLTNSVVPCSCILPYSQHSLQTKIEKSFKNMGGFYRVFLGKNRKRKHHKS